jgi:hypothetical protein
MTPMLLVAFLLVLDVLVLLGRSHDSRDGRDRQPRGSPLAWSVGSCAHLTIRPLSSRLATESGTLQSGLLGRGRRCRGGQRPGNPWRERREVQAVRDGR